MPQTKFVPNSKTASLESQYFEALSKYRLTSSHVSQCARVMNQWKHDKPALLRDIERKKQDMQLSLFPDQSANDDH